MKPDGQKYDSSEMRPILEAVADRMIPEDTWPSATDGGVLAYLERRAGEDVATWVDLIEPGLRALDAEAINLHGRLFSELSANEQDALLHDLERDHVRDWPVSPK